MSLAKSPEARRRHQRDTMFRRLAPILLDLLIEDEAGVPTDESVQRAWHKAAAAGVNRQVLADHVAWRVAKPEFQFARKDQP